MLIEFIQGIYQHQRSRPFLTLTDTGVDINVDDTPTTITFAHGKSNYLFTEYKSIKNAWRGPFPRRKKSWLYWEIDSVTGQRTFGYTNIDPLKDKGFGMSLPKNPVRGQHYFLYTSNQMKYFTGKSWKTVIRVFAGMVSDNGKLTPYTTGSQVNRQVKTHAGYILFNSDLIPVKKNINSHRDEFVTTETKFKIQNDALNEYKIAATQITGRAGEPIPKCYAVSINNGKRYILSSRNSPEFPCVGIAIEDFEIDKIGGILTYGPIQNRLLWNFTSPRGTSVWVGINGELTTDVPKTKSMQKVGYVLDANTVFIDVRNVIKLIDYKEDCIIPRPTPTTTPTITITPTLTQMVTPAPTNTTAVTVTPTMTSEVTPTPTAPVTPTMTVTPTPSLVTLSCAFHEASTIYDENSGWAITQNGYVPGTSHASPFDGIDTTDITMFSVFKPSGLTGDFGISKLLEWGYYTISNESSAMWIDSTIAGINSVNGSLTYNGDYSSDDDYMSRSFNQVGWENTDWYCFATSYQSDAYFSVMLVNLTKGEEIYSTILTSGNDVVQGDTTGTDRSVVGYGCAGKAIDPPEDVFKGLMNQQMVHPGGFLDFEDIGDRRKICGIDGIKPHDNGINIFGTPALYYTECGHPTQNTGTADVDSGGYWLSAPIILSTDVPPYAAPWQVTIFSDTEGYAITQNEYVIGNDHTSPFDAENSDEWSMAMAFCPSGMNLTTLPNNGDRAYLISMGRASSVDPTAASTSIFIYNQAGTLRIGVESTKGGVLTASSVPGGGIDFGEPGWEMTDEYMIVTGHLGPTDYLGIMLTNFTRGEEIFYDWIDTPTDGVGNNGDSTGTQQSVMAYGCSAYIDGTIPSQPYIGTIGQTMLRAFYFDVFYEEHRRRYCSLTGPYNYKTSQTLWPTLGLAADVRYYTSTGHPDDNEGTWDVNSGGYWIQGSISYTNGPYEDENPPVYVTWDN